MVIRSLVFVFVTIYELYFLFQTIERLSHLGLSTHPDTVQRKLTSWKDQLDTEIIDIRTKWAAGGTTKYQLIGDNWDKNILPSYRTSTRKTESLHLFNIYAIVDRVRPQVSDHFYHETLVNAGALDIPLFIPSVTEQQQLMKELVFLFATSVIEMVPQMQTLFSNIYPKHFQHKYSQYCGQKTEQVSIHSSSLKYFALCCMNFLR